MEHRNGSPILPWKREVGTPGENKLRGETGNIENCIGFDISNYAPN
jgi:hypothetical protein